MAKPQTIEIKNFNMGGLSDSMFSGGKNSLYRMRGVDPHTTPGIIQPEGAMLKDDAGDNLPEGDTGKISEMCKFSVSVNSQGNDYILFFSYTSGKIWRYKDNYGYTLVHTTTPASGSAGCFGAIAYGDYVYWFTQNKVHRILIADVAEDEYSGYAAEDWATFTNGDFEWHTALELNGVVYICDGPYIAQIDGVTFSATALDITSPQRCKSLAIFGTDLLIGTIISDLIPLCYIYRWDTISTSWSVSDPIYEIGVNAFIPFDNYVLVSCGINGNIYQYNGEKLDMFKKIPANSRSSWVGKMVNPQSCIIHKNQSLIGFAYQSTNTIGGTGTAIHNDGLYRIARHSSPYPYILDFPYPVSDDGDQSVGNAEIGAVCSFGNSIFMCWKKHDNPDGDFFGVDKLSVDLMMNEGSYIETRNITIGQCSKLNVSKIYAQGPYIQPTYDGDGNLDGKSHVKLSICNGKDPDYGIYGPLVEITDAVLDGTSIFYSRSSADEITNLRVRVTMLNMIGTDPTDDNSDIVDILLESCGVVLS